MEQLPTFAHQNNLETVIANAGDDITALLDGKGSVAIGFFESPRYGFIATLVNPSGQLDSATLIFEGTVVPEPSSLALLLVGMIYLTRKRKT